jgi:DNA polymerase-3 subunit beta
VKLTITRDHLQTLLSAVAGAIPSRSPLAILDHVYLEVAGDILRGTATDLDTIVRTQVPARDVMEGSVCVPAATLKQIAGKLPSGDVVLEVKNFDMTVRSGRARLQVKGMNPEEFPKPVAFDFSNAWTVPAADILEAIALVSFAAATEVTRGALCGVYWHVENGQLWMVASNGHRLALVSMQEPQGAGELLGTEGAVVSPRALQLVRSLLSGAHALEVVRTANYLGFRAGESVVGTRLLTDSYPNYQRVIPQENDKELVADAGAVRRAFDRLAILARDDTHRVHLHLDRAAATRISVDTPDVGGGEDELPDAEYVGDPLHVAFNASYVDDFVRRIPTEKLRWSFSAPARATKMSPVDRESGPDVLYLLMPLNPV